MTAMTVVLWDVETKGLYVINGVKTIRNNPHDIKIILMAGGSHKYFKTKWELQSATIEDVIS